MGFDVYDLKALVEAVYTALHSENEKILNKIEELEKKLNEPLGLVDRLKAQPILKRMEEKPRQTTSEINEEEELIKRMREKAKQKSFVESKKQIETGVEEENQEEYETANADD